MNEKPITITFTPGQIARYAQAWSKMPYGSSIQINRAIDPEAMIKTLENLSGFLSDVAKRHNEQEAQLHKVSGAVASLGTLLKLAAEYSKGTP